MRPTAALPKSADCRLNELLSLEVWLSPSSQKIYYNNDKTHVMPSDGVRKDNKLCGI